MTDEELSRALHGMYAYDTGCTDSGIHDEVLRARCREELKTRTRLDRAEIAPRLFLSRNLRDAYLSEEALEKGYGIEDVASFLNWLDEYMDIVIR